MPGTIAWTTTKPVNSDETVYITISNSLDFVYTPVALEAVASVTSTWDTGSTAMSQWLPLNPIISGNTGSTLLSGTVPIDIFDQYSVTYVDKGASDSTQTPVVTVGLAPVPDFKEVYKIDVDPRLKINAALTITVLIDNGTVFTFNYNFNVLQTYSDVKAWTDNYFSTRY